jgi:hypothetical protein
METKNKKERRKAFRGFLILYIIGIILVAIPLYFTFSLPGRENKHASKELQKMQEQENFQKNFIATRMDSLQDLFERYDMKEVDIHKFNADVGYILSEMDRSIGSDTSWRYYMYENIINTYLSLKKEKNELIEVKDKLSECQDRSSFD